MTPRARSVELTGSSHETSAAATRPSRRIAGEPSDDVRGTCRAVRRLQAHDPARAKQLGIEAATRSAAQKLASRSPWPRPDSTGLLPLNQVVTIDNSGWFTPDEPADVAALIHDVRLGRRLRIDYRPSGQSIWRERDVDPYGVFSRGGRWYLIAEASSEQRMFALARLRSWTVLDEARQIRTDLARTIARRHHDESSDTRDP